ncbi:hypothetical protein GDO78_002912 [Eleutherodactylus coqui]|uniref:VWFA domain-containing protein n=1 Tax=Eleutherodactylus coqui TaxID=57060 RepID=A0A8J6EUV0_ELECQ|nr:hypothetical protein GDO78_002912 [Eleutherodactylus coqui]
MHLPSENKDLRNFLTNFLSSLEISDYCVHVGLVAFNSQAKLISSLSTGISKTIVNKFVEELTASTENIANIGGAINFTRSQVFGDTQASRKNQGIEQIAILVTHRSSADNVSEAAHLIRQESARVFTVGISQANEAQMNQISSHPTQYYKIKLKAFSDLPNNADFLSKKILNAIDRDIFASPRQTDLIRQGCLDTEIADIYLLIDGSGSIQPPEFTAMKTFLVELVEMFDIGPHKVRVGAVQYSSKNQEEFSISTSHSKTNLKLAIQNIRQLGGGTLTGAAINFTSKIILDPRNARPGNVPVYFIVLTDGQSADSVKEASLILRKNKINMYAIGVKEANQTQLLEIAGDSKRVHFVNDFDSLKDIKNVIVQQICSNKVCQNVEADVMFLVDSSGSIGIHEFNKMKVFMKSLVNNTEVGPNNLQFGIVQFSDNPKEELQLNKDGTKEIIWEAIDKMGYLGETTYTGKALEFVSQYFTGNKGARPNVNKFLILITDGEAHDEVKLPSESLRNSGVNIISVGIFNASKPQLLEISGKIERVHYLESFETLKTIEDELIFGICNPPEECARIQVADIVFVMDSSGSISTEQYNTMKDFIVSFVNKSSVGPNNVQFGALKYSDDPEKLFYLNEYNNKQEIIEHIQNDYSKGGSTYTAEALEFSKSFFTEKQGSRQLRGIPQYLIVITDGESHDRDKLNETSKQLQDAGITIYAIGVAQAKTEELQTMAGTKGKWFFVDKFDELKDIFKNISDDACGRTECEREEADITFLIDGSNSIWPDNFIIMKEFMVSVIEDFDIGPNKVHVGVAQYSDAFRPEFHLQTYTDKETLKEKVKAISQIGGSTLIGKALTKTDKNLLSQKAKSRINEGVQQILIVITDGDSYDQVAKPAEAIRSRGVFTYAVGVGNVSDTQLLQIAGSGSSKFSVDNFDELKNIKKRVVRDICEPITANTQTLINSNVTGPFNMTSSALQLMWKTFKNSDIQKASAVMMIVVFTDGLDENVEDLSRTMQDLRRQGLNALVTVALEGANRYDDIKHIEFGRGFEYRYQMHIGMPDIGVRLARQTSHVYEKTCCCVFCKCIGNSGPPGVQGVEGRKGLPGPKGFSGYDGEQGPEGNRGLPGAMGVSGDKGCDGVKGPKGTPGRSGMKGEKGEKGVPGKFGISGTKGYKGPKGLKGDIGEPGIDNDIVGPAGLKGEQGVEGEPGLEGESGEPGAPGRGGIKGDDGTPGFDGEQGLAGPQVKKSSSIPFYM